MKDRNIKESESSSEVDFEKMNEYIKSIAREYKPNPKHKRKTIEEE